MNPAWKKLGIVCLIAVAAFYLNRSGLFQRFLETIAGLGTWAPWCFLLVYVLTCVFFVPSFVFTFAAGTLFSLWQGILLSVAGTGLGSLAAFLIGRYAARDGAARYFGKKKEFRQMDEAVRRKGWKIVLLARLSPVFPFLAGNYAFGLTKIPAAHYALASALGTIPSASVYVYAGRAAGDLALPSLAARQRTPAEWALFAAGLAATVVLTWYIRRVAGEALAKNLNNEKEA